MKWIDANVLQTWADRIGARDQLPSLVAQLVRASASSRESFRFPSGDNAQVPGYDGRLIAEVLPQFHLYVPSGNSVWEFGTDRNPKAKAERDYALRTKTPGASITPSETTFVFVTPRVWARLGPDEWIEQMKGEGLLWKDIRVIDGIALEEWLELCPAVSASFARENGFPLVNDAQSVDEFWDVYSKRCEPALTEGVLLAGRAEQRAQIEQALTESTGILRCKGDSLDEVLAFVAAVIRSAPEESRKYFQARALIVESEVAVRQLKQSRNFIVGVRNAASNVGGSLRDEHMVIVPLGREAIDKSHSIDLKRASTHDMTEALQGMGLSHERAQRLAHECGRSISILGRRIASSSPIEPEWSGQAELIPVLLAGAWDQSLEADRTQMVALSGFKDYDHFESSIRTFRRKADTPIEVVGSVWAVRAPVDLFVHIKHLLGSEHWTCFEQVAHKVLAELDPALELPPSERMYAHLQNQKLQHSTWLREGLATTLLILAALTTEDDTQIEGMAPQAFVNRLVEQLPGLRKDYRVIASLSHQLPMLMEAAPDPLLSALEHLLEGDGAKLAPIFQDSKTDSSLWSGSPHTKLLWALELIGSDPEYLQRAAVVLARLTAIDPGGSLSNRPLGSFRSLFLTWKPTTNASYEMRLAVMDHVFTTQPDVAWPLLCSLLPRQGDNQFASLGPRFREAGASKRETLTYPILFQTISWIVSKAVELAGTDGQRWLTLLEELNHLPVGDRNRVIEAFTLAVPSISEGEYLAIWKGLSKLIRRHRAYPSANWSLAEDQLTSLEKVSSLLSPKEIGMRDRYLFTESLPDIPSLEGNHSWEMIEEMRHEAIRTMLRDSGINSIISFASDVEAPRYVGASLGFVANEAADVLQAVQLSKQQPKQLPGFASAASSAALARFAEDWSSLISHAVHAGEISADFLQKLVEWWPHNVETWRWVAAFGEDAEQRYWQNRHAWGLQAKDANFVYAIEQYLRFGRPEYIVGALYARASEISSQHLVQMLTAYDKRIGERPELLRQQSIEFSVQQIFAVLQGREDVSIEELALLEYRYLPLLREMWSDTNPESAIDRYMADNPAFFVQVISSVFHPVSERSEPKPEASAEMIARAQTGMTLLESFSRVPGCVGSAINSNKLSGWVQIVQSQAKDVDRLEIAEQFVGKMLTHAPSDPEDGMWPHRAVRVGLEQWQSKQIELGIYIGKKNARGSTWRGQFDGGTQERSIADGLRGEAEKMGQWPRTRSIFISLAESYEREARLYDTEVDQLRLRE